MNLLTIALLVFTALNLGASQNSLTVKINGSAIEIFSEVVTSADIERFFTAFDEVRVICGTFRADRNLPRSAKGKNFVVLTNDMKVHGAVTWDLSGASPSPATHCGDSKTLDGADGQPGESGGNCFVRCKHSCDISQSLKIISNGADGSDGVDGANGSNGRNGEDAGIGDFHDDGTPFAVRVDNEENQVAWNAKNDQVLQSFLNSDRKVKRKFILVEKRTLAGNGFMLVRGSDGTKGTAGGRGGLGGEGGHAGEITVDCPNSSVLILNRPGKHGTNGVDGTDGYHGQDGRDAYRLDDIWWSRASFSGLNDRNRYGISQSAVRVDNSVWVNDYGVYAYPTFSHSIPSDVGRAKKEKRDGISKITHAKVKPSIGIEDIESRYGSLLHFYSGARDM